MLFRPPPPRTAVPARLSNLLSALSTAVRRSRVAGRFTGPVDWLRLVVLGVVLVNLAALALADTIFNGKIANGSGLSAIFGGSMLCIAVIRIGRPAIYLDWIVSALLYIGLGIRSCRPFRAGFDACFRAFLPPFHRLRASANMDRRDTRRRRRHGVAHRRRFDGSVLRCVDDLHAAWRDRRRSGFRPVRRSDGARRVHRRIWPIATRDLRVSKATVVIATPSMAFHSRSGGDQEAG